MSGRTIFMPLAGEPAVYTIKPLVRAAKSINVVITNNHIKNFFGLKFNLSCSIGTCVVDTIIIK
ncbi:hypothetical protein [Arcticibacter tournemirensis]|uniref:hypothetical protein n=1 Tax=Arcticibacter tournemirensis TaxID=699437 RepID=UPI001F338724|nr:hypothetical protein [Arcticibacter tournemirensis]